MACKLEDCRLSDDVKEIKSTQRDILEAVGGIRVTVAEQTQKMDDYISHGKLEHEAMKQDIKERTGGVIKFVHVKNTLYVVVAIVGIVGGVLTWG
jgi:hypothetical protein